MMSNSDNLDLEFRVMQLETQMEAARRAMMAATEWIVQTTEVLRVMAEELDSPNIIIPDN